MIMPVQRIPRYELILKVSKLYGLLTKREVKIAKYWRSSFFETEIFETEM